MLKKTIVALLMINSLIFASDKPSLDYQPKKSSEAFMQKHIKIFKNFHLDIHMFGMFSLVDERFQKEYGSYIQDRYEQDQKLFTLTYKF